MFCRSSHGDGKLINRKQYLNSNLVKSEIKETSWGELALELLILGSLFVAGMIQSTLPFPND